MMVLFWPIFVAEAKIIFRYNFVAPLTIYVPMRHLYRKQGNIEIHNQVSKSVETF